MKVTVPVQVRWADLDAYGHVNNAAAFTLLEEARIDYTLADGRKGGVTGFLRVSPDRLRDLSRGAARLHLLETPSA